MNEVIIEGHKTWSIKGLVWIEEPKALPNARTAKNGTYTEESIMFIAGVFAYSTFLANPKSKIKFEIKATNILLKVLNIPLELISSNNG